MKTIRNNNGFTLIEALMSMVVLTVGIMALYTLQISSTQGNSSANHMTMANAASVNGYERLLNAAYDDPEMDPGGNPHDDSEISGFLRPSNVASITWNVTEWTNTDGIDNDGDGDTDEDDELNIKLVDLSVNYQDGSAKNLTTQFLKSEMY